MERRGRVACFFLLALTPLPSWERDQCRQAHGTARLGVAGGDGTGAWDVKPQASFTPLEPHHPGLRCLRAALSGESFDFLLDTSQTVVWRIIVKCRISYKRQH